MTTLPTRNSLTAIGQTYGQVRTAIGDLRDFLGEALGTSGTNPLINSATIANALSVGVRTNTPGADVQINGGLSLTTTPAASINPGSGSVFLEGKAIFPYSMGTKLEFGVPSGNPLGIGRQPDILYYRTKQAGSHVFYSGGIHHDDAFNAGAGGTELLRLSESEFKYKGQTIYHSGNGVFIRKDAADTAQEKITFAKGLVSNTDVVSPVFKSGNGNHGVKAMLVQDEGVSLGVQGATLFARTPYHFAVYRGGTFVDSPSPNPGNNGEMLFYASPSELKYKGQTIYHSGNVNFAEKASAARPGVTKLYRTDADEGSYIQIYYDGSKYFLEAVGSNGSYIPVRVSYSDIAINAYNKAGDGRPLLVQESGSRPGVTRMYVENTDEHRAVVPHWDSGYNHYRLISNTGNPVVTNRSDSSGYADRAVSSGTSDSTNYIHGHNIADGTVRYWELSRGQGSIYGEGSHPFAEFDVHQFAFASPVVYNTSGIIGAIRIGHSYDNWGARRWEWQPNPSDYPRYEGRIHIFWDYITGSGDPYTWVTYDDKGDISVTWDAEDPANRDYPDESPLPGTNAVLVQMPGEKELFPLIDRLDNVELPKRLKRNKRFAEKGNPRKMFKAVLKFYAQQRNLMSEFTEEMDLREFIEDFPGDEQKKNWRKQAIIRALAQIFFDSNNPATSAELISKMYKVNPKNGKLTLK